VPAGATPLSVLALPALPLAPGAVAGAVVPFGLGPMFLFFLKVGSVGTLALLDRAVADAARFLMASTSEAYGDPLVHPQPETYWGNVNPIGPRGVYDEAKRYAEALTMAYHRQQGVNTAIVRIFNTYGPRMRLDDGRVVPNFLQQALRKEPLTIYGDGEQTRSFCYVDDLIAGIAALLEVDEALPVNIGNPRETGVVELAELINEICGNTAGIVFKPRQRGSGDPQRRQPDISRARSLLSWEPKVSLEDGLEETIGFFRKALDL
jgi:dTDP-glucose 4,6-dehydratase